MNPTMQLSEVKILRYSGVRAKNQFEIPNHARAIIKAVPGLAAAMASEPYCIDDAARTATEQVFWEALISGGEVLLCYHAGSGNFAAIHALADVMIGRKALLLSYAAPEARGSAFVDKIMNEVLEYAFAQAPEGLGLMKVQARIATGNSPALGVAAKFGFEAVGILAAEGSFRGSFSDMYLLERLNPSIFPPAEVIQRGIQSELEPGAEPAIAIDEFPGAAALGPADVESELDGDAAELLLSADLESTRVSAKRGRGPDAGTVRGDVGRDGSGVTDRAANDTKRSGRKRNAARRAKAANGAAASK